MELVEATPSAPPTLQTTPKSTKPPEPEEPEEAKEAKDCCERHQVSGAELKASAAVEEQVTNVSVADPPEVCADPPEVCDTGQLFENNPCF